MPDNPVYAKSAAHAATSKQPFGSITWFAGGAVGNATGLTLGRTVIKPGQHNPRHRHNACEEVLHLLSGQLRHSMGDEHFDLAAGDTIVIPAGVYHNAVNTGNVDADMIVAFSSAARDFELEGK